MSLSLVRYDGSYLNISSARYKEWEEEFPGLDIKKEIVKANEWLSRKENRHKNWKTLAGFKGWLKRTWTNSPGAQSQVAAKGQLTYTERVQRESEERAAKEAAIPRPDYEWVREACGRIKRTLPEYHRPQPERVDQLRCRHEFRTSFYGGGDWCGKCGMFRDQWRAV